MEPNQLNGQKETNPDANQNQKVEQNFKRQSNFLLWLNTQKPIKLN